MLKRLSAENYRSFHELNVDLAPITLFVGPNNSGKSSVISLVRLLSQTLESHDPNVRLLLNGSLGDFGTYKDLIHGNQTKKHLKISFAIQPAKDELILGSDRNEVEFSLGYKYRSSLKEVILKDITVKGDGHHHLTAEFIEDSEKFIVRKIANLVVPPSTANSSVLRGFDVRNFIPRILIAPSRTDDVDKLQQKALQEMRMAARNGFVVSKKLQRIEYVGAMRMPPSRTYLYTGERRQKVGANGEHAITMLAMDSIRRGSKSKGIRQGVVKWLNSAGIASDLKIVSLSDRYFEVHVQHPITKEYQNFADVGYGNSQVVPVLVAGLNSSAGDILIAEEPEIHLHPKAQAELGDFLLDLSERGVQSIIETHSEHMIVRLQQHVASGRLDPKSVLIYYVEPKADGKSVNKLPINSEGSFTAPWPGGFFPERLDEARELAKARASRKGHIRETDNKPSE
jgi:predicted ATPase